MASSVYTHVTYLVSTGQLNLASDNLKILLVGDSSGGYVFDPSHTVIDPGANGPTSVAYNELQAASYARGFGAAGRKSLVRTPIKDDNNRLTRILIQNVTWPVLGGAQNDVIRAAVVVKEASSDADSLLIAYWSLPATATAAKDYTLIMDGQNGNIRVLA